MSTTKELVKKCIKGDLYAQEELYKQYAKEMMGMCYRYTKSLADAEDVLQEGFIKVFTKLKQFKNEGELGAWIRKIMIHTAINYLKKHNRYKIELQLEEVPLHPVSYQNPEVVLDTKQLVELIRSLPVGYQTVFNLIAVEGYKQPEVAHILQMNENTVRSKYNRARAMLIHLLENNNWQYKNAYAERL
jgi:RNA polymerase sigma-70 factor (ECF subfamily)